MDINPNKEKMLELFNDPSWCIDCIEVGDQSIEIRGWAVSQNTHYSNSSFAFNGRLFDEVIYPIDREDIDRLFWFIDDSKKSGFVCKSKIDKDELLKDGMITLSHVEKGTGKPINVRQNYYYYDNTACVALPSSERRMKVHGGDSVSSFLLEGFSTYIKCNEALKSVFEKSYDDFGKILDWGCGCGRMTRYFNPKQGTTLDGVDIDSDNIKWSRENLKFAKFEEIQLHPPSDLSDDRYDLIIGISIFTHLKEVEQFEWLDELKRISAKGAILLMTVHGKSTACRSGAAVESIIKWQECGFWDLGGNPDLKDAIPDNDYYRNTLHTAEYLKKEWSRYFDIVEIIPGYIGNHQDLVVLRKR